MFGDGKSRSTDSLDIYMKEVEKKPLLKQGEDYYIGYWMQKRLPGSYEQGRQELIESNLRFVISVAKKYQNQGVQLKDLIQVGNKGLVTAADKWDYTRKVKFISYAVWWIRQGILQELSEHSGVARIPLNRASEVAQVNKLMNKHMVLLGKNEREAIDLALEELDRQAISANLEKKVRSEQQKIELRNVAMRVHHARNPTRLDAPIGDGSSELSERMLYDEGSADYDAEQNAEREYIERMFEGMQPRDVRVLRLYFGLETGEQMTLEEIGNLLGITRERVRQLRDRALVRARTKAEKMPDQHKLSYEIGKVHEILPYHQELKPTGTD